MNVARDEGWNVSLVAFGGFALMVGAWMLLTSAIRTAERRRDDPAEVGS